MSEIPGTISAVDGCALPLSSIVEPVADEIALVEEYLVTNLIDDNAFVTELLAQTFRAGGKRIRQ